MLLNKNQIEAVRYQLKKLNISATNDEIRLVANGFEDFDAIIIANQIAANKEQSLVAGNEAISESLAVSGEENKLAIKNPESTQNTLSTAQKNSLVRIKSQELGISLDNLEIAKISDMVSDQITDSVEFLNEVGNLIEQFLINRNRQTLQIINQKVENIANIINTKNEELGDIFNSANNRLNQIANECNQSRTDYKSAYKSKIENIKEMLKL